MKLIHLIVAVALSLGLAGIVTASSQPASAAATHSKTYKSYKSIPKVLRGTWRTKGYTEYSSDSRKKVRCIYKINKHTYSMKIDFQGKRKSKTIHFLKKEIQDIEYIYKLKRYWINPTGVKSEPKRGYASLLSIRVMQRHGKKVLAIDPIAGKHIMYLYRQ